MPSHRLALASRITILCFLVADQSLYMSSTQLFSKRKMEAGEVRELAQGHAVGSESHSGLMADLRPEL